MDRLRPPPARLPLRVLVLCLAISVTLLLQNGGPPLYALMLSVGTLPLEPDGTRMFRVLFGLCLRSGSLIVLALVLGMSFSMAGALIASRLGGRISRLAGWIGRATSSIPPMGLALGLLVLMISRLHVPVETLFPWQAPAGAENTLQNIGRILWSWAVPAIALAAPVAGASLFSLTHRLSVLLSAPEISRLRARGLSRGRIIHHHLVPQLLAHASRLARPSVAMLLAWDIPIEELLGFDGWGRYAATQLTQFTLPTNAASAVLWSGGCILTVVLSVFSIIDRRALPPGADEISENAVPRSLRSAICGVLLALALASLPVWLPGNVVTHFREAQAHWWHELLRALSLSLAALAVVLVCGFVMHLTRQRILSRAWAAALANMPLLTALLFAEHSIGRNVWLLVAALSLPGIAALRESAEDSDSQNFVEASRMLGLPHTRAWLRHVLPHIAPAMMSWTLRNLGTAFIVLSVLDFYSDDKSGAAGWGRLMREHAGSILDDPLPALAPAVLIALWSLSFRLLSRGFRIDTPRPRTSPFAT